MATISEALAVALYHHRRGRLTAAERIYHQILEVNPNQSDAIHLLGVLANQFGKHELAVEYIKRAIELEEKVADYHNNLGKAYRDLGKTPEAIIQYRRALELEPELTAAHNNLGCALKDLGHLDEAIACLGRALELDTSFAEAHNNLGLAFRAQGKLAEALACFGRALDLKPDFAEAHNHFADARKEEGKLEEAEGGFRTALEIDPSFAEAHTNLGLILLLRGDYEEGWREYEHRSERSPAPGRFFKSRWAGGRAENRTVLIHGEQGFGDTLQFVRYARLVRPRSGARQVVLNVQPELMRLLAHHGGWGVKIMSRISVDGPSPPPFDYEIPLLSLPLALGLFEPLPMTSKYLRADPELRGEWRRRLGVTRALRVGLAWAGNPEHKLDRLRSIPGETLWPLLQVPRIRFYSLQVGFPSRRAPVLEEAGLIDLTAHLTDFAETAALVAELDLVITVDTAVAHLAGGMGRPVWTLLPFVPDWRWGQKGERTPWYPTMRLFRQPKRCDWDSVLQRIGEELAFWVRAETKKRHSPGSLTSCL